MQLENGANIGDELGVWHSPLDPSPGAAEGFLCIRGGSALHRSFQAIWGGTVRLCIKQKQKQTLNKGKQMAKHNPETCEVAPWLGAYTSHLQDLIRSLTLMSGGSPLPKTLAPNGSKAFGVNLLSCTQSHTWIHTYN